MAKNTNTSFPTNIDDRIFFQDINLSQVDSMSQYQELIKNNNYTQASTLLSNSGIDYYGAWVLNLLEKRLLAIETYIKTKTKPELTIYGGTEPTKSGIHWIN